MDFNVEIVRSNRKRSVGFSVRWPDTMVVTAPRDLSGKTLDKMILERRDWAARRLDKLTADYRRLGLPKQYTGGETFPYLGGDYRLTLLVSGSSARTKCSLVDGRIMVEIPRTEEDEQPELVSKAINSWYRQQAEEEIRVSTEHWIPVIGKAPVTARIRNQRARWGSCSHKGAVNLNWRLILLPREILDYVVIHELCHLRHPDHSHDFWDLVAAITPDYKNLRKQLRAFSPYLDQM